MFEEKNTANNLPAEISLFANEGLEYKFAFVQKGGGSANKSFLLAAMLCIETIIAILTPRALVQISAAFATAKRLTGVSVAYNISYLLASCMPLIILACGEVRSLAIIILLTINLVIVTIRFKPKELHVSNS